MNEKVGIIKHHLLSIIDELTDLDFRIGDFQEDVALVILSILKYIDGEVTVDNVLQLLNASTSLVQRAISEKKVISLT